MKTRITSTIEPGDMAVFDNKLWYAVVFDPTLPCSAQCGMYDKEADRCPDHCYRWKEGDGIVFRYVIDAGLVKDDTEVVQTPDPIMLRYAGVESAYKAKTKYYAEQLARRRERDKRDFGTGTLYQKATLWCAEIFIEGESLRMTDPDKAKVERWLDDMAARKKALKELAKLKKNDKKS